MNVKHYIDAGYTIFADTNIARVIRIDFPEARENVHPIEDRYSYAGISAEKILFVSESSLPSIYSKVGPMIHVAKEVVYIKKEGRLEKGLTLEETRQVASALAELRQRISVNV